MAKRGHEFTPDERDRALIALALNAGNTRRTHEALKQDTTLTRTPSRQVLDKWKVQHAERYEEIRTQHAPAIEAAAVHDWRAIVAEGTRAQLEATRRATEGLDELAGHEAARVAKDLSIATGVAADKLALWTDRPTVRIERRTPQELLREMDSILGTATEIENDADETQNTALMAASGLPNARELGAGG